MAEEETFRAADQHNPRIRCIDGAPRRSHQGYRFIEPVEGLLGASRRILDRESGHACLNAAADIAGELVKVRGAPVLEIGVDRQVGRLNDLREMVQSSVERCGHVRMPPRKSEARACRSQGGETEMGKVAGRTDVPWVRHDEAVAIMQRAKAGATFGNLGLRHRIPHPERRS